MYSLYKYYHWGSSVFDASWSFFEDKVSVPICKVAWWHLVSLEVCLRGGWSPRWHTRSPVECGPGEHHQGRQFGSLACSFAWTSGQPISHSLHPGLLCVGLWPKVNLTQSLYKGKWTYYSNVHLTIFCWCHCVPTTVRVLDICFGRHS